MTRVRWSIVRHRCPATSCDSGQARAYRTFYALSSVAGRFPIREPTSSQPMADLQHVHAKGFGHRLHRFGCGPYTRARYFSNAAYYARQTRMACSCARGSGQPSNAMETIP